MAAAAEPGQDERAAARRDALQHDVSQHDVLHHDVLHHLLDLEAEAQALVNDAQAEADKRVAEGEKKGRESHDAAYGAEAARLEAEYGREIAAVRADYQTRLDAYGEELRGRPVDRAAFGALAEKFFGGGV